MGGDKMKEMYFLDLEINRVKREEEIERTVRDRQESCRNNELLGKLSNTLVSSYLVHFDEIVGLLIDEVLEDEVIYLNNLEAEYKIGRS